MTDPQTYPENPISLPDPTRPPQPVPGCVVCSGQESLRQAAERKHDIRRATDCEMEIRRHPNHEDTQP